LHWSKRPSLWRRRLGSMQQCCGPISGTGERIAQLTESHRASTSHRRCKNIIVKAVHASSWTVGGDVYSD
jgi:hypothetical protein